MNFVNEHHYDPSRRIWACMNCHEVNAWDWDDADYMNDRWKLNVKVSHGSAFDNICGHCGADIVEADSPILHPCYTHSED